MIRKPEECKRAIELRQKGRSVKEIGKILNVSSSTVSLWVRHVPLSSLQKQRLQNKVFRALQRGRKKAERVQKRLRKIKKAKLTKEALKELGILTKRDLFIAGIALYWAEGFKKDNRLGFASSDAAMIRLFLKWLISVGVPKNNIRSRVGLNISQKKRIKEIEKYWSDQTAIPLPQFQKPFFQKFKWKKEFPNPEKYFGVLRIRANNQGDLFIKIKSWIEKLRE